MSTTDGPSIDALTHRLADTPAAFLGDPRVEGRGDVFVEAVVGDLMYDHDEIVTPAELAPFSGASGTRNWLRLVSITCWLAHDPWFRENGSHGRKILEFLTAELGKLATLVAAELFTSDPDRREELARLLLQHLSLKPEGESEDQAADRLSTVNTVERARVLQEMKEKRERAKKLREEMERKRAREAAAKYSRE